ncbi:MAG: helix-turn-helix transcriptional regulator [Rhizobiales bacterium]|nr:helix-turn-helix transcriptional regulator [Hyphomicrobiales bacterium]
MKHDQFILRLKKIIGRQSIRGFAQNVGINDGTLRSILKGSKPSIEIAAAICEYANVSLDWLIIGKEASDKNIKIPRHNLSLSAGGGSPVDEAELIDYVPFTSEFFQKKLPYVDVKNLIIFDALGDSMEPTVHNNDLIMVDMSKSVLMDGVYAFTIDNSAYIKRLQTGINEVIIRSDNHELYPPLRIKNEDLNSIKIIGKVIWKGSIFGR